MNDSIGPVRRRRIAGESGPAAPAAKAAPKRAVPRRAPAVPKSDAPAVNAPAAKTSTVKPGVPAPERRRRSGPAPRDLLWLIPSTLIAVAALIAGTFLILHPPGSDDGDLDASRRQASSAAATAAETIFSFRFDQLDEHLEASKALMTPAFAKQFDTIAPALTELAPQRKIVVEAVARESAALPCGDECSPTAAEVLVFVDQARLVGDSTTPTVFANRIKVSMVKKADGWAVSNIRAL